MTSFKNLLGAREASISSLKDRDDDFLEFQIQDHRNENLSLFDDQGHLDD